jgi:hypothetical protein
VRSKNMGLSFWIPLACGSAQAANFNGASSLRFREIIPSDLPYVLFYVCPVARI